MKKLLTLLLFGLLLASCGKEVELPDPHEIELEKIEIDSDIEFDESGNAALRATSSMQLNACLGNCNHVPIMIDRASNTYSTCQEVSFDIPGGLDLEYEIKDGNRTIVRIILNEHQLCGPSAGLYNFHDLNCVTAWHDFQSWEEATEIEFVLSHDDCLHAADYWRLDLALQ